MMILSNPANLSSAPKNPPTLAEPIPLLKAFFVSTDTLHAPPARVPTNTPTPKVSKFSGSDHFTLGFNSFKSIHVFIDLPPTHLFAYFSVGSVHTLLSVRLTRKILPA